MPEHDTFDLDAAFARLEQDVTDSLHRPAGPVPRSPRARRRRRRAGAVVVVAVLAVGGVAVGQGLSGHDDSIAPSGSPSRACAARRCRT